MHVPSESRIGEILSPTGSAGGTRPYLASVQSFSIEQIVHPRGLVALVAESTGPTHPIPTASRATI